MPNEVDPTGQCVAKSLCLQYAPQSWRCGCLELCTPAATCNELRANGCTDVLNKRNCPPPPTDSPDVHPCTTRQIFPVFGQCGDKCIPRIAGSGYNPDNHRAVDIVPIGAYENYPDSTYLAPDWSTRAKTQHYRFVYAVADGTIIGPDIVGIDDTIVLRLKSEIWEFVYVHIEPTKTQGDVRAGTILGWVIPYAQASHTYETSDRDHLHFGLRNPSRIMQSLDPGPCLWGS